MHTTENSPSAPPASAADSALAGGKKKKYVRLAMKKISIANEMLASSKTVPCEEEKLRALAERVIPNFTRKWRRANPEGWCDYDEACETGFFYYFGPQCEYDEYFGGGEWHDYDAVCEEGAVVPTSTEGVTYETEGWIDDDFGADGYVIYHNGIRIGRLVLTIPCFWCAPDT